MQKTLAIIALIVLGCTALEVVDVIFTMQLYSGLLPWRQPHDEACINNII
jgi:hypothetical protein